jgi:hypothetical protein
MQYHPHSRSDSRSVSLVAGEHAQDAMLFPMPVWWQRSCASRFAQSNESECSGYGKCGRSGECECDEGYDNVDKFSCERINPSSRLGGVEITFTAVGSIIGAALLCFVFVKWQRMRWEMHKAELDYARWGKSGEVVEAPPIASGSWHVFVSHVWSSGQECVRLCSGRACPSRPVHGRRIVRTRHRLRSLCTPLCAVKRGRSRRSSDTTSSSSKSSSTSTVSTAATPFHLTTCDRCLGAQSTLDAYMLRSDCVQISSISRNWRRTSSAPRRFSCSSPVQSTIMGSNAPIT